MARGKGSNTTSVRHSDAVELMRRLDIGRLRQLINQAFPATKIQQVSAQTLLMNCLTPGHPDVHPSFYIDLKRGRAFCKSPACGYSTRNLLQLLQDCRGWSYAEGLSQVQAITGARLVSEKLDAAYEDLDQHRTAVGTVAWAVNAFLVGMIAPPDNDPAYDPIARHAAGTALSWLFEHRGHRKDLAAYLPYGLWPPLNQLMAMCERRLGDMASEEYRAGHTARLSPDRREKILDRIRKLVETVGNEWTYTVAFVTGHDFNTPARIRLRRPDQEDQKQGNIFTLPGHTPDEAYGYFGLYAPHLTGLTKREARSLRVLEVEGEHDTLTVAEGLITESITSWTVVGSCGDDGTAASNEIDALEDAGIDTVYLLHDHPDPERGRGESWLRKKLTTARKVDPRVFTRWHDLRSENQLAKDPDDVIRLSGFLHFKRVVLDEPDKSFVSSDMWAIGRAIEDGRDLADVRERTAVAARYGECLAHPERLANFLDRVAGPLGVAPGVVRAQIVRGQDDEAGFVSRIADTVSHDLHFLYKEDTLKGAIVHAYHKDTQRPVRFHVDDGPGTLSALSNVVGDVHEYFASRVGLPGWLSDARAAEAGSPVLREIQKPLGDYTRIALQRVFQGLPSREECEIVGLGPHLRENAEAPYGVLQYINTGNRVMRCKFVEAEKLQAEYLPGPSDGRMLFTLSPTPFRGHCRTPEDIAWGNTVTLEDLAGVLKDLVTILNCWGFRRGKLEALTVALDLFHCAAPHFCPDKIITGITGPTGSGKSKLMALFCGGQHPELQMVDWATYQSNYTPAGLYNFFDGSTNLMALEEFTADALHRMKAQQVEDVMELIRQVPFAGGAQIRRMYGGVSRVMSIHTNVLVTSIHPPRDIQDANRRLEIETVKVVGHRDPAVEMFRHVTAERLAYMRKALNIGLLKYYGRYRALYDTIAPLLATDMPSELKVESRFLRSLAGPATMLALLGGDWRQFVRECVNARRDTLDAYAHSTPTNILFDTLLRTNGVKVGPNFTSVMAQLAEPDKWGVLNGTTCGVLYNDLKGYLVVDWIAALSNGGVLNRAEPWCREPYHRLKYQLDQHASAVGHQDFAELGVEDFLNACGASSQPHLISVFKIGSFVSRLRELNLRRSAAPPAHPTPAEGPQPAAATPPAQGAPQTANATLPPGMRRGNNL